MGVFPMATTLAAMFVGKLKIKTVEGADASVINVMKEKFYFILKFSIKSLIFRGKKREIDYIDPYEVPKKEWSEEIEDYPGITFLDITSYLILQTSSYTMEEFRAYKGLKAYNQLVSG